MKKSRMIKSGFKTMGRHKVRTFFMMLGIIVGITALTMIFSFGKGAEKDITGKINKFFSADSLLIRGGRLQMQGGRHSLENTANFTLADLDTLGANVPGIDRWDPMLIMPEQEVKYREKSINVRIFGHSPAAEQVWHRSVTSGEFFAPEDMIKTARVALIGEITAKELFGDGDPIGIQIRIGNIPFRVKGVLEPIGADPHGNNRDNEIHVPITTAMRRMMNVDYIQMAKILIKDPGQMSEVSTQISGILRERHHISPGETDDFHIITPVKVQEMLSQAKNIFSLFLPLIAGISLLVGGVVAANLMLIAVNERTAEIGLRKAVGGRSQDILVQFLMEAALITGVGGIIGIIAGLAGVKVLSAMTGIPAAISWQALLLGIAFPILVGLGAGVFPARRAAAFDPVDTLR